MIEENDKEPPPLDPEKVREFMFEAISAMSPRIFRPVQEAHPSYGTPPAAVKRPAVVSGAGAFAGGVAAGAVIAVLWKRRHSWSEKHWRLSP